MANIVEKTNEFDKGGFKSLPVSEKFKKVFGKFRMNLVLIFIVIILIDIVALFNLRNIYAIYYEQNSQQGEIRITIQALAKYYLWAMSATEDSDRQEGRLCGDLLPRRPARQVTSITRD